MRITILNQFFHPDISATAQIATELAVDLAAAGHQVTALCARGSYFGTSALPAKDRYRGVDIVRAFSTSRGKGSNLARLTDYGTFLGSLSLSILAARTDLILCMSTPPMLLSVASAMISLRGARSRPKLVYWAQDVYPQLASALGMLAPDGLAFKALHKLQRSMLRRCDLVVTLGQVMADRLRAERGEHGPTVVIPNWADGQLIVPQDPLTSEVRSHVPGHVQTLVMYSGNMGRAHDIETILAAARHLSGRSDIGFLFIGGGAKAHLVEAAATQSKNIWRLPYQAKEQLSGSLAAGDIHLASMSSEALGLMEPSKVYGIMAAGRPCVFVGPKEAEVAQSLIRCGGGLAINNGDAAALAETLRKLADAPQERLAMGAASRQSYLELYDRPVAAQKFLQTLEDVVTTT